MSELPECCKAATCWMRLNWLQPKILTNPNFCGVPHAGVNINCQHVHGCSVDPETSVRNLGIVIDCDLSMCTQLRMWQEVSRCVAVLRQLRQIRRSVPAETFQTLVVALAHFRLDYGNAALVGLLAQSATPSSVCAQCSCSVDLSSWIPWPYHRRSYLPPLVACSAAYWVQAGCVTYKFFIQPSNVLPWPSRPCRRPVRPHRSPASAGRCTSCMERSAKHCYICSVTLFPAPYGDLSFSAILSWHHCNTWVDLVIVLSI